MKSKIKGLVFLLYFKIYDNIKGVGIKGIIESGLSKSGENLGGVNTLIRVQRNEIDITDEMCKGTTVLI